VCLIIFAENLFVYLSIVISKKKKKKKIDGLKSYT
jgi:hypothetical protein